MVYELMLKIFIIFALASVLSDFLIFHKSFVVRNIQGFIIRNSLYPNFFKSSFNHQGIKIAYSIVRKKNYSILKKLNNIIKSDNVPAKRGASRLLAAPRAAIILVQCVIKTHHSHQHLYHPIVFDA